MNDKPRKKWYEIINDHYWKALYATMTYNIILAIIDLFYPLSMVMMLTPVPIYLFLLCCNRIGWQKTLEKWRQEEQAFQKGDKIK